jgi:surfeit locus 1 family protein
MLRRLAFPLVIGLGGTAILVALGIWQMQRLEWKRGILAEIEARIAAPPAELPEAPDPEAHRYLPVAVEGRFVEGQNVGGELLVLISLKGIGPAYRVIAPFVTEDGRRILVDRGYVPDAAKAALRPGGEASLVGNLHWPDETDGFTPDPDGALWFARDVPAMAGYLGTEPVLLVLREPSETATGITPLPVDSGGIPNNHLQYAITWFSLAAIWLAMTGMFAAKRRGAGG